MENDKLLQLAERYEEITFLVHKRGEFLTNKEINDELTYDQHYTLRYIRKRNSCTSTELAKEFHVKKSAITALINRLVEKGFVKRKRNAKDRRVVHLCLTAKGVSFYNECNEKIHDVVAGLISHFTDDEIEAFMNTYEKLAKVMENAIAQMER